MPRNGSGTYTRTHDWTADRDAQIDISASRMDEEFDDLATELTGSLAKDGQTTPTANQPMGGFRHTGTHASSGQGARTEYTSAGTIQDNAVAFVAGGGTGDAITATFAPAVATLVDGMELCVRAPGANTVAAPTFAPNGLTARSITKYGGAPLFVGDYASGQELRLRYRLSATRWELVNPQVLPPRGHIAGLALSNNGSDASNDIDIAVGEAADSTTVAAMRLTSALTKRLDAAWAVGTNQGGLDTGAKATSTWYHLFLIRRSDTGVVDVLFSASATSPTMPTSYDQKRRIGAVYNGPGDTLLPFSQFGEHFVWSSCTEDVGVTNLGTSATLYTLRVPTGVKVLAEFNAYAQRAAAVTFVFFSSPDSSDQTVDTTEARQSLTAYGTNGSSGQFRVRTDTSGRIRAVSGAANTDLELSGTGWIDYRGRFD